MAKQYTFEVRMDYLLRMMAAEMRNRGWYDVEAELISANSAFDKAVKRERTRRKARTRKASR